jgi:replicative DNA helicase
VTLSLEPLSFVLDQADRRVRSGLPASRVWPTGFEVLDDALNGGFRSGDLVLLGGAQGLGKTTWALQVARHTVRLGRPVVVLSFEHDLSSLLVRLVALEAGQIGGIIAPNVTRIRAAFEGTDGRRGSLTDRLVDTECGVEALEVVAEYGDRLLLHRATGTGTDLAAIAAAIEQARDRTGESPMVIVDYLQKVAVEDIADEEERTRIITEGLKELALDNDLPVLAVAAMDKEALLSGKRLRVGNMRGSSALAYEPDTVLLLNNKYDVVARHHLVYSTGNAEAFRNWAVLSVEKNRNGRTGVDLEFQKRFEQCRFESQGRRVTEKLVDDRVFVE